MGDAVRIRKIAAVAIALLAGAAWSMGEPKAPAHVLELGDPAPALQVSAIKGDATNLTMGGGKHVHIIEFWATWCGPCKYSIPHLTKMQGKYRDKGLVVVGISAETPPVVKPYVAAQGDNMNYTVAVDDARKTSRAYMEPFGVTGIPWAFVVDRDGLLVWAGHPMDPFMEELVAALVDQDTSNATPGKSDPGQGPTAAIRKTP